MKELQLKIAVSIFNVLLCTFSFCTSTNAESSPTSPDWKQFVSKLGSIQNIRTTSDSSSENLPFPTTSTSSKIQGESTVIPQNSSILLTKSELPGLVTKNTIGSKTMMLAMIAIAVGTTCALATVVFIFVMKRKANSKAKSNENEVRRHLAMRTNMYVIRNENCDLKNALSRIPSSIEIWRDMQAEP